jgi:hypothetical protein
METDIAVRPPRQIPKWLKERRKEGRKKEKQGRGGG